MTLNMINKNATEEEIENRLDLFLLREFEDQKKLRDSHYDARYNWRRIPKLSRLAPSSMLGLACISEADDDLAIINLADYFFEKYLLSTMSIGQVRDYYLSITTRFELTGSFDEIDSQRPLVLETMHHHCIFSIMYSIMQKLIQEHGFKKFILLHIQKQLDVRFSLCVTLFATYFPDTELKAICISNDNWTVDLDKEMGPGSTILYMGDIPPQAFGKNKKTRNYNLHLPLEDGSIVEAERLSAASILARRYRAAHHSLDFPQMNVINFTAAQKVIKCPFSSWVFWPMLHKHYRHSILKKATL